MKAERPNVPLELRTYTCSLYSVDLRSEQDIVAKTMMHAARKFANKCCSYRPSGVIYTLEVCHNGLLIASGNVEFKAGKVHVLKMNYTAFGKEGV